MPTPHEPVSPQPSSGLPCIAVVDDDAQIRRLLERYLGGEGFRVATFDSAESFWPKVEALAPRVVILDVALPGEDGISVARRLRGRTRTGIIMLTTKNDTVDRVVGLEVGADDYVPKPFELRELLARLRSLLRRLQEPASPAPEPSSARVVRFDGWQLDLDRRELTSAEGEPVPITNKEFQVLELLVSRPNRPVSRDAIVGHTDGREHHPLDRSVDVLMFQLRAKMERLPGPPRMLKTVRGVGYMLVADVTTIQNA